MNNDKSIPKDIPITQEELIDAAFGNPIRATNGRRVVMLRSCAEWLTIRSNSFNARNLGWSAIMQTYAKDLHEIADFIERCQNA